MDILISIENSGMLVNSKVDHHDFTQPFNLVDTLMNNSRTDAISSSQQECRQYANYLCSLSLQQLQQEPTALEKAELQLAGQTQDLLCSNYGAVIASAQITAHVQEGLRQVDQHLSSVDEQLPAFTLKLAEFGEEAKHIAKRLVFSS